MMETTTIGMKNVTRLDCENGWTLEHVDSGRLLISCWAKYGLDIPILIFLSMTPPMTMPTFTPPCRRLSFS